MINEFWGDTIIYMSMRKVMVKVTLKIASKV